MRFSSGCFIVLLIFLAAEVSDAKKDKGIQKLEGKVSDLSSTLPKILRFQKESKETLSHIKDFFDKLHIKATKMKKYIGCFKDNANRMIKAQWVRSHCMSHNWCISYCRERNHKFAGLQNREHCFCGDSIDKDKYPRRPENECNKPCKGNPLEMCGGTSRNTLYRLY